MGSIQTFLHVAIYAPGTFYCNPLKPILNYIYGSSYGIAYAHFRRDHSIPANVYAHVVCLFFQLWGNFAVLYCIDKAIFGFILSSSSYDNIPRLDVSSITAFLWIISLFFTPSPISVKFGCFLLIFSSYLTRSYFVESIGYIYLSLFIAPFEISCYWLLSVEHGFKRPNLNKCLLMLMIRIFIFFALYPFIGILNNLLLHIGGNNAGQLSVISILIMGSLSRAKDNLPIVEHIGLAGWILAMLLDTPWIFFICSGLIK